MGDNTSLLSDYYGLFSLYLGKALTFSLSLTFSIPAPVIAGSKHLFLAQITVSDRKSTTFYGHTSWPGLPIILDSGIQLCRLRITCQWNLDSGLQSFAGFRIPRAGSIG